MAKCIICEPRPRRPRMRYYDLKQLKFTGAVDAGASASYGPSTTLPGSSAWTIDEDGTVHLYVETVSRRVKGGPRYCMGWAVTGTLRDEDRAAIVDAKRSGNDDEAVRILAQVLGGKIVTSSVTDTDFDK